MLYALRSQNSESIAQFPSTAGSVIIAAVVSLVVAAAVAISGIVLQGISTVMTISLFFLLLGLFFTGQMSVQLILRGVSDEANRTEELSDHDSNEKPTEKEETNGTSDG